MTDYYFKHVRGPHFTCAKFTDSDQPEDVYKMTYNQHHEVCDCPSYKQPCKHIKMLQEAIEQTGGGDPISSIYFDDQKNEWTDNPLYTNRASEKLDGE